MGKFNKCLILLSILFAALLPRAAELPLSECKEKAAQGDAEALYQLGVRYENGDGVTKDKLKAVVQYRKAAEKNHKAACLRLVGLYETGTIVAKDPVKAARYRAIAKEQNVDAAEKEVKTAQGRAKVDHIEVALDYIIGRNGKARNAKQGIQLLYKVAKDNPTAQRVFVERWEKGDLDEGLSTLSAEDWELVIPWFKAQYKQGKYTCGLVLGNEAYRKKEYEKAARYYSAAGEAGLAKAWLYCGNLYYVDEKDEGGAPSSMHNDAKAKSAYDKCLRLNSNYEGVELAIGYICLFSKTQSCLDYQRAFKIFRKAMKSYPNDKTYPLWCAHAITSHVWSWLDSRWPDRELEDVRRIRATQERRGLNYFEQNKIDRYRADTKILMEQTKLASEYALKAAQMGNKDAEKFYNLLIENLKDYQKVTD